MIEETEKKYSPELYKKWFKAGGNSGFISITPWWEAQKFAVDIGAVNPDTNAVTSSTKCFVDMVELATYTQAIILGQGVALYPKRSQCPSPESFVSFGGTGELSRVFKIHYWGAKQDTEGNSTGFAWKCGHFGGKVSSTGAIEPIWDDRKSADMIKVSRLEMHEINLRLQASVIRAAIRSEDGIVA